MIAITNADAFKMAQAEVLLNPDAEVFIIVVKAAEVRVISSDFKTESLVRALKTLKVESKGRIPPKKPTKIRKWPARRNP